MRAAAATLADLAPPATRSAAVPQPFAAPVARPRAHRLLDGAGLAAARLVTDLLGLWTAVLLVLLAVPSAASQPTAPLLLPGLALAALAARGAYGPRHGDPGPATVTGALGTAALAATALADVVSTRPVAAPPSLVVAIAATGAVLAGRAALRSARRRAHVNGAGHTTLILGAGEVADALAARLAARPEFGLRVAGLVDDQGGRTGTAGVACLGGFADLEAVVAHTGATHVVVAFSATGDHALAALVRRCEALRLRVCVVPRLYEHVTDRAALGRVGTLPLVELRPTDPHSAAFVVKHVADRVAAAILLVVCAPLLAPLALAIRLESPGPVIFRQRRVGRDGRPFELLKLRTMRERDTPAFAPAPGRAPGGVEGEDRRTPLGRLLRRASLDELPQLLNVLRGEMSLVGPRPERPEYVARFDRDVERYTERHRVKAGMTGLAQIRGLRGQTCLDDRVACDNHYIAHWSPWMDLRILAATPMALLRGAE